MVWPVTAIAAVSAREQVAQTGLIAVPPASKDREKLDRSLAPKPAKAEPDASTSTARTRRFVSSGNPLNFLTCPKVLVQKNQSYLALAALRCARLCVG